MIAVLSCVMRAPAHAAVNRGESMPHIRMRSIKPEQAARLSSSLLKDLAQAMNTTEDNFTFELIQTQFYEKGQKVESYPFIEVHAFERPNEIRDLSAKIITQKVKDLIPNQDIIVVFTKLEKPAYYENGEHH